MQRLRFSGTYYSSRRWADMGNQYSGYIDHIRIGHAGDALQIIGQILSEKEFDPESVRAVFEALKDAIQQGILQ